MLNLFSNQAAFYEDGSKKPDGLLNAEDRNAYYEQNRRLSKKHINITAKSIESFQYRYIAFKAVSFGQHILNIFYCR